MRSYISSSNEIEWKKVWAWAIGSAVVVLICAELLLRFYGYDTTIVDDSKLWSLEREKVGFCEKEIVLAGSSRMLTDVSVDALESYFPEYKVINLAINGSCPNDVIMDLASNSSFRGVLIVDFREECLYFGNANYLTGNEYIKYYHLNYNINNKINRLISNFLQERIVLVDPYLNIFKFWGTYLRDHSPRKHRYWRTDIRRSQCVNYDRVDLDVYFKGKKNEIEERENLFKTKKDNVQFDLNVDQLRSAINIISNRGGKTIFLRLPVSEKGWQYDQSFFPREKYWYPIMNTMNAYQVHFKDYDELQEYECPDNSHIDCKDKHEFTLKLARMIEETIAAY